MCQIWKDGFLLPCVKHCSPLRDTVLVSLKTCSIKILQCAIHLASQEMTDYGDCRDDFDEDYVQELTENLDVLYAELARRSEAATPSLPQVSVDTKSNQPYNKNTTKREPRKQTKKSKK